jgi:glyoxylase-like metal-dependent hydrolase (beta-lactamase superfamily II)
MEERNTEYRRDSRMRVVAFLVALSSAAAASAQTWSEVVPGVLRSNSIPSAYALVSEDGKSAVVVDLPDGRMIDELKGRGVAVTSVLLTHHHRDTAGGAVVAAMRGVPVRGPKAEEQFLTVEGVTKYWKTMLPVPSSNLGYFVLPAGIRDLKADLEDGTGIDAGGWSIRAVATPGHTRGHLAFRAARAGRAVLIAGDALASEGKLWSPSSTDWDHWTDAGLSPAAATLRRLADNQQNTALKVDAVCPAHGPPIAADIEGVLRRTAERVAEAAFLKSFERFTKHRLGRAPEYKFLVPRETIVGLKGKSERFTEVSQHLFILDNCYVLKSKSGRAIIIDLYGRNIVEKIRELAKERNISGFDATLVSHAHYDHYLAIHDWKEPLPVWALEPIAEVLEQPLRYYAPFIDPRPIKVEKKMKDGQTVAWQEYTFRFHHLPGQTHFTQGVEVVIDGRKCLFTADNFYHQDQFSGSGGWMALNRAAPAGYADGARKVMEIKPHWVLAEHGGPFEYSPEDFRRRVMWGEAASTALDSICPSGDHRLDYDLHRVRVEPLVSKGTAAGTIKLKGIALNPTFEAQSLRIELEDRGELRRGEPLNFDIPPTSRISWDWTINLRGPPPGRHVFAIRVISKRGVEPVDAFFAVDVE